jgi:Arc/MetJ-type ribon-helix-helix transcriptional regulator
VAVGTPSRKPFRSTSVTLTDEQVADLRLIADRRLSSISQVIREAVKSVVEREKHETTHGR